MKKLVLLLAIICSAGCADHSKNQATAARRPLQSFEEGNFGVSFSHSELITTSYNPHGGADRVGISYKGTLIGGLAIRTAPPTDNIDEFINSGREHFKESYGAADVEYSLIKTPKGYPFHFFKAKTTADEVSYVIEKYVYLRDQATKATDSQSSEAIVRALMNNMSGSFSFEFGCKTADYEKIKPEIQTVIDTFMISQKTRPERLSNRLPVVKP
jgi:hypothetical protein